MKNTLLKIGTLSIQPGERITVALPTPEIYTCAPMYIPVHVIHGKKPGPVLLVCGAIHGDEANGVAITHRLLKLKLLSALQGTLIVIPTINIYGMITQSRNLPDRRDLEGVFPGSKSGSFASRLAYFLTEEIFSQITHCIDLHTGEPHISKFPQVKTSFAHKGAKELAHHFKSPAIVDTDLDQGLLWLLNWEKKTVPTIIYQTGEARRLDPKGVHLGVRGIVRVMKSLSMLPTKIESGKGFFSVEVDKERWVRAASSGLCETFFKQGGRVQKGDLLAKIFDPFGTDQKEEITSPVSGVVIGCNHLPILNEGEPILQIAELGEADMDNIQNWPKEEQEEERPFE